MKKLLVAISLGFCLSCAIAQEGPNKNNVLRTISVTGSAEIEIVPDEIIATIGIQEYYEEELIPGKEFKDYKNFVDLESIENKLMAKMKELGADPSRLIVQNSGTAWFYGTGKNKKRKDYKISFKSYAELDKVVKGLTVEGLSHIRIDELKNKDMEKHRLEVKIMALKAAKTKASQMLAALDKQIGEVVSIAEINNDLAGHYPENAVFRSNTFKGVEENEMEFRKIKMRFEVNAVFEIK